MNGFEVQAHTLSPGKPGAPAVVFAHGLEGHWLSWTPLAGHLDPGWRLVALELPWRAGNDYRWRHRPAGAWLGDGLDLAGTPDVLVAHSFGANAALELLGSLDPRTGRATALICPFYRLPRYPITWRMYDRSRAQFTAHVEAGVRARLGRRGAAIEPDVLDGMVRLALDRAGPLGFTAVFDRYVASAELPLGEIESPTTVMAGARDATLSAECARELARAIPGARLSVHPAGDHFFHVRYARDAAAEVAALVTGVLATRTKVGEPR